nr:FAD-binding protein [Actinomycetota bacterium]
MRNHAGWGEREHALGAGERDSLASLLEMALGAHGAYQEAVPLSGVRMPPSRLGQLPPPLAAITLADTASRALHSYGRSFPELVRARAGDFPDAVDGVLFPESEADVIEVLDFARRSGAVVVPYGGGSSVVGGIGPVPRSEYPLVLALDTARLAGVADVDLHNQTARLGAGLLGPALEDALRPHR